MKTSLFKTAFAVLASLLLPGAVAYAQDKPYTYAPEDCEFRLVFPGEPYTAKKCDPDDPDKCSQRTSYTKVFGTEASINFHATCNKAEENMYERYSGEVMQTTLKAMVGHIDKLDDVQTGFQQGDLAKQAIILGSGKTGTSDKIYTAQLWIGKKSVFTVEGELIGGPLDEADKMFADILRSIHHESQDENPAEKAEEKQEEKSGKPEEPKKAK